MTKKEKEFEVQKALGLAMECTLTIRTGSQLSAQKIKDVVKKHTFTSRCTEISYYSQHYADMLKFEVKCVNEIMGRIAAELHPYFVEIKIIFQEAHKIIIENEYVPYGRTKR